MKVVQIHSGTMGSIGKIIADISGGLTDKGIENYAVLADCSYEKKPDNYVVFSDLKRNKMNRLLGRATGFNNCFAIGATKNLIRELERIGPDIVHLHNLHDGYVNIKMLFAYLSKKDINVVWTLHDCWSFTGGCPHFDAVGCQKWKAECYDCPIYREYPKAEFDRSKYLYRLKKNAFNSVRKLQLVCPSSWLANHARESFFKNVPISVIHNGINLDVFHPTQSNLRVRYQLENKQIILGVAAPFDKRKGVHIFERLAKDLPQERFAVVMIGLSEEQVNSMSDNMIKLRRTANQIELAEWYTAADVFVNPSYEDVFGTTNIEAMACGTPVVMFRSGGNPETITEQTGIVVACDDYQALLNAILKEDYKFLKGEKCIARAQELSKENMVKTYIRTYEERMEY